MSAEDTKEIVCRFWEEGWNQQNLDRFDELMDRQYAALEHSWSAEVWAAYPDTHFELHDLIAESDKVVTRVTLNGTHSGEFWGVAPTGKKMSVGAMFIHRVVDGRIQWDGRFGVIDLLGWQQQLGLVPPSVSSPP